MKWNIDDFDIYERNDNVELCKYTGINPIVKIPNGVKEIQSDAFWGKDFIEEIIFPDTVTELPKDLLTDLPNLERVQFSKNTHSIPSFFFWGSGIRELLLPETVTEISSSALSGCERLIKVAIGKNCRLHREVFGGTGSVGFNQSKNAVVYYPDDYKYKDELKTLPKEIKTCQINRIINDIRTIEQCIEYVLCVIENYGGFRAFLTIFGVLMTIAGLFTYVDVAVLFGILTVMLVLLNIRYISKYYW